MITLQLVELNSHNATFRMKTHPSHIVILMTADAWAANGRPAELHVTIEDFVKPKPDPR